MHLEPVARLGGHERPLARMVLHLQSEVVGPVDHRLELLLVERDAEVVDARDVPVARLEDDVDGAPPELHEPQAKAHLVESLPGRPGLEPLRALALPAVAADQLEAELAEIAPLEEPHLARHEVVVEQLHGSGQILRAGIDVLRAVLRPHHVDAADSSPDAVLRPALLRDAAMPTLNGELIVFMLVWVVVFIITLAADSVDWPGFVTASVILAGAYMISRGIAKAGKVLEGR